MIYEKIKYFQKISVFLIVFFIMSIYSFAEKIYLKNGRTIEGIIEKQDDVKVVLDIGFGTITLSKNEIESIEGVSLQDKADIESEWRDKYFLRSGFIPKKFKEVAAEIKNLDALRNQARKNQQLKDSTVKKVGKIVIFRAKLNNELIKVDKKITAVKRKKFSKNYQDLVLKHNSLVAELAKNNDEKEKLEKEIDSYDHKISDYRDTLNSIFVVLTNSFKDGNTPEEKQFVRNARNFANDFRRDFKPYSFDYKFSGDHCVVNAFLNNKVSASLMVDTGASIVMLSKGLARRLRIDLNLGVPISVKIADGRTISARGIVLDSIKVGDAEVKAVNVAVLVEEVGSIGDGLLGMSFLKYFTIEMDIGKNIFSLKKFRPQ